MNRLLDVFNLLKKMDTLDTAAVYNNFGVVAFYMESFLPAKKLYEFVL